MNIKTHEEAHSALEKIDGRLAEVIHFVVDEMKASDALRLVEARARIKTEMAETRYAMHRPLRLPNRAPREPPVSA